MDLPPPSPSSLPSPPPGALANRRRSLVYKISGIGLLILILQVPLLMTDGVLTERLRFQRQATEEIAGVWGRHQLVTGPVLAVPYVYRKLVAQSKIVDGRVAQVDALVLIPATAYFLPEKLAVTGAIDPEVRRRGIYETVVYSTRLHLAGEFRPDFGAARIEAERIDWDKAEVQFGVSDLRGIRSVSPLKLTEGKTMEFESVDSSGGALLPLEARVVGAVAGGLLSFEFEAALQGSERLEIVPAGKVMTTALQSTWVDPSFFGASLPIKRSVGADGFKAEWETSHFSRGFAQSWTTRVSANADILRKLSDASFGVIFEQPVGGYRLVERAQKYGVLFFSLVFGVFFLFEITAGLRIHPLQYAMVGAALCLFFLGFLALSELMQTTVAYVLAAAACTALISLYTWSFLKTGRRTLVIGGGLSATYGYLYFVLQSQDYALAAGTLALFVALALGMFCTRQLNWYDLDLTVALPNGATAKQ